MPSVTCPTCGEKGKVPSHLVGARIKCKICHTSFLVAPPAGHKPAEAHASATAAAATPTPAPPRARRDGIEVEGLDESAWTTVPDAPSSGAAAAVAVAHHAHDDHEHEHHDEASSSFTASHGEGHGLKQYKLLTAKDKFFEAGKFDLPLLEEAINHYARQGWVVRSMATPHIAGFSGGLKEELVVLLER